MTRIVLIRHGQTAWNREERFRGRADIPLDEVGRVQAEATAARVAQKWPVVAVYRFEAPHEVRIPGGESLADLRRRAMEAIRNLGANHPRQTITVVGHTVLNRVILLAALGLGNERFWHLSQDTCAINVLETRGDDFVIVTMNLSPARA